MEIGVLMECTFMPKSILKLVFCLNLDPAGKLLDGGDVRYRKVSRESLRHELSSGAKNGRAWSSVLTTDARQLG